MNQLVRCGANAAGITLAEATASTVACAGICKYGTSLLFKHCMGVCLTAAYGFEAGTTIYKLGHCLENYMNAMDGYNAWFNRCMCAAGDE